MSARDDIIAAAAVALALAVAGCGEPATAPAANAPYRWANLGCCLSRVVDEDAAVVCWVRSRGISCLPCADVAPGVCDEATP